VLVQTALAIAGGGESCADIEHLRAEPDLFGAVPSDGHAALGDPQPPLLEELLSTRSLICLPRVPTLSGRSRRGLTVSGRFVPSFTIAYPCSRVLVCPVRVLTR
jgi:hypothetical protein